MPNVLNGKSKWTLVPIGIVGVVIASVAAYGQIHGAIDANMGTLQRDVNVIAVLLPEISDRLTAIEIALAKQGTDIAWIKGGMKHE